MVVMRWLEWLGGVRVNEEEWVYLMVFRVLGCNGFEVLGMGGF